MQSKWLWVLIMMALILGMIFWYSGGSQIKDEMPYYLKRLIGETAKVQIRDAVIQAEVAKTANARAKGLSGRDSLEPGKGMLFVFPQAGTYPFTLVNTKISLDIIWILNGQIVYIAREVPSGTAEVLPEGLADNVLEVNSSVAGRHSWQVGDKVTIADGASATR